MDKKAQALSESMNNIVCVIKDPSVRPEAEVRPIFYRRNSLTQLMANDTRRYVKDDVTYDVRVDEYFASIRKFIFDKYKTINKNHVKFGNFQTRLSSLNNKGYVVNRFNKR